MRSVATIRREVAQTEGRAHERSEVAARRRAALNAKTAALCAKVPRYVIGRTAAVAGLGVFAAIPAFVDPDIVHYIWPSPPDRVPSSRRVTRQEFPPSAKATICRASRPRRETPRQRRKSAEVRNRRVSTIGVYQPRQRPAIRRAAGRNRRARQPIRRAASLNCRARQPIRRARRVKCRAPV